ncbi:MAG: hypothetical protein U0703_26550 [Anaerolineae bacterium]
MSDLVLAWSDVVLDLRDLLADHPEPVYIVGGAVRDALLRRPIKDVDIAAPERAIPLARRIANGLGGAFFVLDAERDVGRALLDTPDGRLSIDVAGFRGDSLDADLRDRDFTINALAVDLRGDLSQVIDPTGGAKDALAKIIRRCNPDAIAHDPIRALRAVRQSVQFGFRIDPATQDDIRAHAANLLDTSMERLRDELFKLLALSKPGAALRVADRLGLLTVIVPEVAPLHDLKQHPAHARCLESHAGGGRQPERHPRRDQPAPHRRNGGSVQPRHDRRRAGSLPAAASDAFRQGGTGRALASRPASSGGAAARHRQGDRRAGRRREREPALSRSRNGRRGRGGRARRSAAPQPRRGRARRRAGALSHGVGAVAGRTDAAGDLPFLEAARRRGIDLIVLTLADYLGAVGVRFDQDLWLKLLERAQIC